MPNQHPLGNTARWILEDLMKAVQGNITKISQIKHLMHLGKTDEAQKAQEDATEVEMLVIRVLTSLVVLDVEGAEQSLADYKNKKGGK